MTDAARDAARTAANDVKNAARKVTGKTAAGAESTTDRVVDGPDSTRASDTGRKVGEGVGGAAGVGAGAAVGSLAGPVGTVVGAIAGAVGGWWAGRGVSDAAASYSNTNDTYYRNRFADLPESSRGRFASYDRARPAYELGYLASQNPDYRGRSFDQVESDLRRGWTPEVERETGYSWNDARNVVAEGYAHGSTSAQERTAAQGSTTANEQRITRSEEELVVSKRPVKAGEVDLKKTVQTEHVSKSVPLRHDEVDVERHPISADRNAKDVKIGEQTVSIPLTAEEPVVNKRAVAKEEVIVKKHAVEEKRNVEADLRKERVDINKSGRANTTNTDTNPDVPPR
ncbi:MAG TPA: YsnF/AvaK domain-containing protein [Gemmatimonadaceae bacterium]|nr:YsnF/AvaK domain-containing protein [Gemmatimonadaceae bacterium]